MGNINENRKLMVEKIKKNNKTLGISELMLYIYKVMIEGCIPQSLLMYYLLVI